MELRIREILAQRGMTLKDLALQAGISASNLSNYLNGNISPTLETLRKIARCLDVDIADLFRERDEIEIYAKIDGVLYPIFKEDIVNIVTERKK